jgi:hypothetical protein
MQIDAKQDVAVHKQIEPIDKNVKSCRLYQDIASPSVRFLGIKRHAIVTTPKYPPLLTPVKGEAPRIPSNTVPGLNDKPDENLSTTMVSVSDAPPLLPSSHTVPSRDPSPCEKPPSDPCPSEYNGNVLLKSIREFNKNKHLKVDQTVKWPTWNRQFASMTILGNT